MLWIAVGVVLVVAIGVIRVILAPRAGDVHDLGSVSDQWIAQHRVDSP